MHPVNVSPIYLLCDMDGTLIDTEGLKDEALRLAVSEARGVELDAEEHTRAYSQFVGMPGIVIAREMISHFNLQASAEELWRLREHYRQILYSDTVALRQRLMLPVVAFVERFRLGIRVTGKGAAVLVTTAGGDQVDVVLRATGISGLFEHIVSGLEKSRENPACYRAALEACGAKPHECLALEDSTAGYEAARALGIPCILLPNAYTQDQRLGT